jgi:Fe-S-cluster containining protein
MSLHGAREAPGLGTARFTLKVQDSNVEVSAKLPDGPLHPTLLLPVLQSLSDSISELAIEKAKRLGQQLSCREGCGACCRQAVPITPVEARAIAQWLAEQPEPRQTILRERFRQAAAKLEVSGIAEQTRKGPNLSDRPAMQELGLKYFALGIACPFLEQERCSIHPMRPLRCREYLVASPAERCAHPESKGIVGIRPAVVLSEILARWDTNGDPHPRELILLTMLDEWIEGHPAGQDRPGRTAPELLQEFLHALATDARPAADDPRGTEGPLSSSPSSADDRRSEEN